jgi:hypothetical protein
MEIIHLVDNPVIPVAGLKRIHIDYGAGACGRVAAAYHVGRIFVSEFPPPAFRRARFNDALRSAVGVPVGWWPDPKKLDMTKMEFCFKKGSR